RVNCSLFYQISLVNNVLNQDAVRRTLEQHDMAITVAEGKRTDSAVSGMLDVTQAVTGFFGPKGIAVSALISGGRGLYDTYIAHDNLDSITQATAPAASAVSLGSLNPVNIEPLDFFFAYYGSLEITRLLKNNDAELVITDIDIKIIDSKIATATLNYESRLSGSAIDTFDGIIFDMVNIDGIWYIDEADMESFIEAYLESIHGSISS
ncbi:MAG: hypothetical protein FWE68_00395, partial [Defluviitaleaceae bacterium]|nr:hypothetical protein [Defluviitaleaceae bacterium]